MPHERKRHLASLLKHVAGYSPLVGILGHRQVGKTTLLEKASHTYLSFDDEELLAKATQSPKSFLSELQHTGCALDECQLAEPLFPALKERVRKDKRPGQFYLSGSVRFTSKKLIRESLTGRIISMDLLPLTLSELDEGALPDRVSALFQARRIEDVFQPKLSEREFSRRRHLMELYLTQGGLPGACFIRSDALRRQKLLSQLETILGRDLHQVVPTSLTPPDILRYVRELALEDGGTFQYQDLRRRTGITPATQKKLLYALEAVFVLRSIPIEGDSPGQAIWFEDQAEALVLSQGRISAADQWAGLIYRNLREQVMYRLGSNAEIFQYRTRSGVTVPIAIRTEAGVLGFVPVLGKPSPKHLAAGQSFLRKYANSRVNFVTDGNEARSLNERTWMVPASQLLLAE
jgi:predicted AAA+ superfamily ATPase